MRRAFWWFPILGIAAATPFLVWFAMGDVDTGDSYEFGPYHVGPSSGYYVPAVAALVALVGFGVLVARTRRGVVSWWWWAVVAALVGAGSVAGFGWRVATAGSGGANIGGGFAVLVGPPLIAGLLVLAVRLALVADRASFPPQERQAPRFALGWARLLTVAALLVAPALFAMENALAQYQRTLPPRDDSVGLITDRQYALVRFGQTRTEVHLKLGRELPDFTKGAFPAAPPGLLCDDYIESNYAHEYRLCYRNGALVSKAKN